MKLRHGMVAALLGLAMLVARSDAAAGDDKTEEARAYFNHGVESFRDGAYDAALVQFKAAYATAPNYRVLYNIGQTSLKLQDFAAGLSAFERYLAEGGAEVPSDRRTAVEQEIERLARRVSRVSIVSNAAAGEVLVDDVSVGHLPLTDGVRVSAGRRKITIVPDGGAPISRVVDVPGGTPVRVELSVVRAPTESRPPPAPSVAPPSVAPPAPTHGDRTGAWVALGGGAVLAVGAGVAGIVALGAKSDADAELGRYPASRKDLDDARSRMKSTALVADVLGLAALVSGGVGVTLLLINRSGSPSASPTLDAGVGPGQLRLRARF